MEIAGNSQSRLAIHCSGRPETPQEQGIEEERRIEGVEVQLRDRRGLFN